MAFLPGLDKEVEKKEEVSNKITKCFKCDSTKLETTGYKTLMYHCNGCGASWPVAGSTDMFGLTVQEQNQFIKDCEQEARDYVWEDM